MKVYRILKTAFGEKIKGWHMTDPLGNDVTLCGDSWGDSTYETKDYKATCEMCVEIIRGCKKADI